MFWYSYVYIKMKFFFSSRLGNIRFVVDGRRVLLFVGFVFRYRVFYSLYGVCEVFRGVVGMV